MSKEEKNEFVKMEEDVISFWKKNNIFEQSVEKDPSNGVYNFYDGPPFGTGEPHYGHIMSSVTKDVVPRYFTMKGYRVERKWGWDCHGLPIENIIEKDFSISGKKEIEKMGVAKFNESCRARVLEYANSWDVMIERIGRWVDFKNSYKTMDKDYMESVWWGFKETWKRGLVYEGKKVLLYCPRCETPISNFEVAMDNSYKDIVDETVYVKFKTIDGAKKLGLSGDLFVLAWTTTPWTLPGNAALAVGEEILYLIVKEKKDDSQCVIAKDRVEDVFANEDIDVIKEVKGIDLKGVRYHPLFSVSAEEDDKQKHYVATADFVTTESGTGIVHVAPAYGEDDNELSKKLNLPIISTLDNKGHFTDAVKELEGLYFQKANSIIIEKLNKDGLLALKKEFTHSYPHCHRCDTKLLYNAIPAWFLKISSIRERMLELNKNINWYPEHLKEGRFAKGIEQAPDWNISRNRFFATPIPLWRCASCREVEVLGSVRELEQKSGEGDIADIHNHNIDHLTWQCQECGDEMRRIEEVFDCWVESGSMPFAQAHYPFENQEDFKKSFPAQFISEYISQTRAWFYVMHVISTSVFDSHSFDNVVANGVILNEKGEKLSKSKKNYPDPYKTINSFGADSLRAYLMGSSVMHAENLFFNETEVRDIFRKNIGTLWNVYKFYQMNATARNYSFDTQLTPTPENTLDKWIIAKLNELIEEVTMSMDSYNIPFAVRPLGRFINDFSTWYIRRSRNRFKENNEKDVNSALLTTAYTLVELSKLMAPFMPFIAEQIYQRVTEKDFKDKNCSVHLDSWPESKEVDKQVITTMDAAREIVEEGLSKRAEAGIKIRQPLPYYSTSVVENLPQEYAAIVIEELNVKKLLFGDNKLGTEITEDLLLEGAVREVVRTVNALRKELNLTIGDKVSVFWSTEGGSKSFSQKVFSKHEDEIKRSVEALIIKEALEEEGEASKKIKLNEETVTIFVNRK